MNFKVGEKVKVKGLYDHVICEIRSIYKIDNDYYCNVFNVEYYGTNIKGEYTRIRLSRLISIETINSKKIEDFKEIDFSFNNAEQLSLF